MRRKPPSTKRCAISRIVTWNPAAAQAWAIPDPMVPAPITAIFLKSLNCMDSLASRDMVGRAKDLAPFDEAAIEDAAPQELDRRGPVRSRCGEARTRQSPSPSFQS